MKIISKDKAAAVRRINARLNTAGLVLVEYAGECFVTEKETGLVLDKGVAILDYDQALNKEEAGQPVRMVVEMLALLRRKLIASGEGVEAE